MLQIRLQMSISCAFMCYFSISLLKLKTFRPFYFRNWLSTSMLSWKLVVLIKKSGHSSFFSPTDVRHVFHWLRKKGGGSVQKLPEYVFGTEIMGGTENFSTNFSVWLWFLAKDGWFSRYDDDHACVKNGNSFTKEKRRMLSMHLGLGSGEIL